MKSLLAALLLLVPTVSAQETQISTVFVLKQQTRLGYEPASVGVKIEGVYKLNEQWVILGSASGFHSPKLDSGTGKSGFLTLGTRWAPIKIKEVRIFGEFDAILGALVTDPYRKTVFHFRNAIGVKLLDGRLMIDVARLYQDLLPDAEKLLKDRGFDTSALHTANNQLSSWEAEGHFWAQPFKEGGRLGAKGGLRYSMTKFVKTGGERTSGWFLEFTIGPYWKF